MRPGPALPHEVQMIEKRTFTPPDRTLGTVRNLGRHSASVVVDPKRRPTSADDQTLILFHW